MGLNCKQGDLALVIGSHPVNSGQVVTCLELLPVGFFRDDLEPGISQQVDPDEGPLWRTDKPLSWGEDGPPYMYIAPDRILRPITPPSDLAVDTEQGLADNAVAQGA